MKKIITLFFTFIMIFCIGSTINAQVYETGKVYVEGKSTAYGDGDTITVKCGDTFHIARISDGKAPLSEGDFWLSGWDPFTLSENGFVFYGLDGEDGAPFKDSEEAWGPFVDTSKVIPGTYTLSFYFLSFKDIVEHEFSGAKQYDPLDVKINVTKGVQNLSVTAAQKTVSSKTVKKKEVTVSSVINVKNAKTTVTYAKKSGSKYLKVNSKNGKILVKKGTPKGTYTAEVVVSAKENTFYSAAKKNIKVTIKVK